jgi:formylglycine-generating enzyme required for sulfatase activity
MAMGTILDGLLAITLAAAGAKEEMFRVPSLPAVPAAQAPGALDAGAARGLDFRGVDMGALKKYNDAFKLDGDDDAPPETKAAAWRRLAEGAPGFAELAGKRAAEWARYAAGQRAADEARQRWIEARDSDWDNISERLTMAVVPAADKALWAGQFVYKYLRFPGVEPEMARVLVGLVPAGPEAIRLEEAARSVQKEAARSGKAGIQWVRIPGGNFMMSSESGLSYEEPVHRVTVKSFRMAKTEVTNKQYRACVEAGACTPPGPDCGYYSFADDQPVVCVDWKQAGAFAAWVGGRLPTEAEWEYAARSAGKNWKYPWGNEDAACGKAVMNKGCGRNATWPVCSKTAGNTRQGLCDMAGNVWEWTQDGYHDSYDGAPANGGAWESPAGSYRVLRGGSWRNDAADLRASSRGRGDPGGSDVALGFRPAR